MTRTEHSGSSPGRITPWLLLLLLCAGCAQHVLSSPPRTTTPDKTSSPLALSIVRTARTQVGAPYHWGGDTPTRGFDCSGLVTYAFSSHGVSLPRISWEQFNTGRPVPWSEMRAGDLIFFKVVKDSKSFHVGIVTERGTFIHSPSTGRTVRETALSAPYWQARFVTARRVL